MRRERKKGSKGDGEVGKAGTDRQEQRERYGLHGAQTGGPRAGGRREEAPPPQGAPAHRDAPPSPVPADASRTETVELVPFGSTQIRISLFPWAREGL